MTMSKKLETTIVHSMKANPQALSKLRIKHPNWVLAHDEINRVHQSGINDGDAKAVFIYGESGVGKTSIFNSYHASYPNVELDHKTKIRILRIDTPAKPTEMTLSQAMLIALGDPFSKAKDTATEKTNRVIHLLSKAEVELIMLDEYHHVLNTPREETESTTWTKTMMNRTKIPFVIAGLPICRELVSRHTELKRRLSSQVMLTQFSIETLEERSTFASVLHKLAEWLPFEEKPSFKEDGLLTRFHFASAGLFGYMTKLWPRARDISLKRGENSVSLSDWEEAFRREIWFDAPSRLNPFSTEFCFRPLNRPGEPFEGLWPFPLDQK